MTGYKTTYIAILALLLVFVFSIDAFSQLGSFNARKNFIIESDSVSGSSDITDYPLLFSITDNDLRDTGNGGSVQNSNGFDIAFSAADGTTALDFQLESYDPAAGTIVAWVRIPTLSASTDTQFFLYYNDGTIVSDQSSTTTWDANYVLVAHMDDVNDQSQSGFTGSNNGTVSTTGLIGNARDFETTGGDDFITFPDDNALDITGDITISLWYRAESDNDPDLVTKGTNQSYEAAHRGGLRMQWRKNGGNGLTAVASTAFALNEYVHFAYIQNSSGRQIIQNGVEIRSDGNTTAFATNANPLQISRSGDAADGIIDEVRISNVARDIDYIATEVTNHLNPGTFIVELPDVPQLGNIEGSNITYTAGGAAQFISNSLTVNTHPTITTLDSAVVQITANLDNPDDKLNFTNQLGITGTYTAATGKLLLSGSSSLANYQTAIRSVTYSSNNAVNPLQNTRTVSITGYSTTEPTNTLTRDIDLIITIVDPTSDIPNVVFVIDSQDLDGDGILNNAEVLPPTDGSAVSTWGDLSTNNYDFGVGNAAVFDSLGLGERGSVFFNGTNDDLFTPDNADINNATFTEKAFGLVFRTGADQTGFNVIYEQSTGGRGYNFTILDGTLYAQAYSRNDTNWDPSSNPLRHKVINLGAVVSNQTYIVIAYHDNNIWAANVNGGSVTEITDAGPMPAENTDVGVGGNFNNTRNPVTFGNQNGNYNGEIVEIGTWNTTFNAGQLASLFQYYDNKWGNTPPLLAAIEGTNIDFTEGDPDTQITNSITVTDSDPHLNLDSAKVTISANFASGEDELIFTNFSNITGNFNSTSGELLLAGFDTKANYQTALRSVLYRNTSGAPSSLTRTVDFEVYDWDDVSNTQSRNITVTDIAQSPVLAAIEGPNLAYTEGDGAVAITSTITATDPDDVNLESATIAITNNYILGEDFLDFVDTGNISGSFASGTGILTLTGTDTEANYQAALRAVTYENTSGDPITLDRTVSFTVNDGTSDSNTESRDISITAVNSKPVIANVETSNLLYPDAAVQITNTLTISDPDDTLLDTAFVIIAQNFKPAEDSLIYNTLFGITGNYNSTTGILTLIGNNLISDYEAALRSVEYVNTATIAQGPERFIGFVVDDGAAKSDTVFRVVDVSPVETISGLEVWLRADAGISEGNGVPITTWADQSGNGNDYVGTADIGTAPTYVASNASLNNQPSVNFAGNGDHFLDSDGHTNYLNGSTEFTLFVVIQSDVTGTDRGLFIGDDPVGADEIITIRYDAAGANAGGAFTNVVKTGILGNTPNNQLESFSDIQTTDPQILSLNWNSGSAYDIYVDGILNNPSFAASPPTGTLTTATTAILGKGGKDDGPTQNNNNSWDGDIAEFIYYSRNLTDTERESVEDYLSDKYDTPIRKITPATGGDNISADDANTTFTSLTGPIVQEGFIGEFTGSGTFVLSAPSGFEWNTSGTYGTVVSPAFGGTTELVASFTSVTATNLTFTINTASSTNPGQIEFTGLEIRPTTGTTPNEGDITNTGSTGQGGATNYGTITMVAGAADSLIIIQQPTTTNRDSAITPSVRVQVVDQFGNSIEQSGTNIDISIASGTGVLSGTATQATNVLGIAEFDDLTIDLIGTKTLRVSNGGLNPDTSSTFDIVNAGTLTEFIVERFPSGNISSKTAGQTFNITITAVDGTATPITTFNGTVVISSNCTIGTGQGTTPNFVNGVLSTYTVSITSVGSCEITATNSTGPEFGDSNTFAVSAGAASEATSTITASPTVILNNGSSTSTITVQLFDAFNNPLTSGGDAVALARAPAQGTLGGVTDNSDGTYTATLTSSTTATTVTVTGTVNAAAITDDADVEYAAFTHIWTSQLGSASDASNYEDTNNWNVGTLPGPGSTLLIPTNPSVGNEYPVVDVAGQSIGSISMEPGASLTISGGINFTVEDDISGGSILGSNADSLTVGGNILNVSTISVGTVILNGTSPQLITSPFDYVDLTLDNTTDVSITGDLNVTGTLTLTNGQFIIPTDKDFISQSIVYGSGELRFQRSISGVRGWRLISSPVSSTIGDLLDGTLTQGYTGSTLGNAPLDSLQPNVLYYDETQIGTDNQRYRAPSNITDAVVEGRGYFVFFFGDVTGDSRYNDPLPDTLDVAGQEFDGNGTTVTFPVTYTALADTGWNLIGNPFGATLDWDDNSNWTKTNMENTIYVWDPAANSGNGEYLSWNGSTGTLGSGLIAPFQGFWVKASAASPVLAVNRDARTTGGAFLRKQANVYDPPQIAFEVSAEGLSKVTTMMFSNDASVGKDDSDAYLLSPFSFSRIEAYTLLSDGTQLDINNLPLDLTNRYRIPLDVKGFNNGRPIIGDFQIRWINIDNIPEDWIIKLLDNETGEEFDLLEEGTDENYIFSHTTREKFAVNSPGQNMKLVQKSSSQSTRFTILITTEEIEANIPQAVFLDQNYPNPFNPSTVIPFGLDSDSDVLLEVYDILGRRVTTLADRRFTAGRYELRFDATGLASGVYIYRLVTNSKVITKKLTLIR